MRSAVLAALVAALLLPAGAAAQSSPFAPLPTPQSEQPAAPVASNDDDEGISSLQQTLLIAAGIAFVLGIGLLIARDARRNAPVDARASRPYDVEPVDGVGERKKRDARAQQKQKAAAKRARQARKKNRPVRK